jgi:hypothetical protein
MPGNLNQHSPKINRRSNAARSGVSNRAAKGWLHWSARGSEMHSGAADATRSMRAGTHPRHGWEVGNDTEFTQTGSRFSCAQESTPLHPNRSTTTNGQRVAH